jgi:deoxyribodipyrimidine photo-lyase
MQTPTAGPIILWFRRDLRLADNPALAHAAAGGRPVIPVFILDTAEGLRPLGGAGRWWLDRSLRALDEDLRGRGSRLILRRGAAGDVLAGLAAQTGAAEVCWNRLYEPQAAARDGRLETALKAQGVSVHSFNAALLNEPQGVQTGSGGGYQVFGAYWRTARARIGEINLAPAPRRPAAPAAWPESDDLDGWGLHPRAPDWSRGFADWVPGEAGAQAQLDRFLEAGLDDYDQARDRPGVDGTSRLSPHLHWGEIGPRQVWSAVQTQAHAHHGLGADADRFLTELGWREFNHHLAWHRPDLLRRNIRPAFDDFPWRDDADGFAAWAHGQTGYPIVDAGMRQLWATGWMHNRVRMIVASFLVKDLLVDWRRGEAWFWDTLVDADAANNAGNWQWVAGCGADAAPFFRIFNPTAQGERFDPGGGYVRRWVPELKGLPDKLIHQPWSADPEALAAAKVRLGETYPRPIVDHAKARARALAAYAEIRADPGLGKAEALES